MTERLVNAGGNNFTISSIGLDKSVNRLAIKTLFRYGIAALINAVLTGHQLFGDEEAAERGDIRVERFQERIHLELMVGTSGIEALHDVFQDHALLLELCGDGHELAIVDERGEHLFRITGIVDELFLPSGCVAIHEGNLSFTQQELELCRGGRQVPMSMKCRSHRVVAD